MHRLLPVPLLALLLFFAAGCGDNSPTAEPTMSPPTQGASGLAGLDPADRELAKAQGVCPISGAQLGSMGTPVKLTVEGRTVFLCCEGCRKTFEADPAKHLAKLDGR